MDADGGNKKKLTNNDNKTAHGPTFSPDGKTILFMSDIQGSLGRRCRFGQWMLMETISSVSRRGTRIIRALIIVQMDNTLRTSQTGTDTGTFM